mmetsp:Transcript_2362/g.6895  ORF Transcript_2362/g.6895 Transcript_2362/m.6895 type:complete len:259 (-) Transcript_2362:395-1171(-)
MIRVHLAQEGRYHTRPKEMGVQGVLLGDCLAHTRGTEHVQSSAPLTVARTVLLAVKNELLHALEVLGEVESTTVLGKARTHWEILMVGKVGDVAAVWAPVHEHRAVARGAPEDGGSLRRVVVVARQRSAVVDAIAHVRALEQLDELVVVELRTISLWQVVGRVEPLKEGVNVDVVLERNPGVVVALPDVEVVAVDLGEVPVLHTCVLGQVTVRDVVRPEVVLVRKAYNGDNVRRHSSPLLHAKPAHLHVDQMTLVRAP